MSIENSKDVRLGGALFSISTLAMMVIVPLYLYGFGLPEGTGPDGAITAKDSAAHLLQKWDFASHKWEVEVSAITLLVISSFLLSFRPNRNGTWVSPRLSWICVAVGGLCAIPMYFVMLGGYLPAAQVIESEPTIYPVLRGFATVTFAFGVAVIHLGMAGAFWSERTSKIIPSWLALIGVISSLLAFFLLYLLFVGSGSLQIAGPAGFVSYVVGFILGIAIWRDG